MKTAAVILNHNLPHYTDMLYESLKPYERGDYDLMVFDNGSTDSGKSKYTTYGLDRNVYFGGGFNAAMQMMLEDEQYDSLLFLNNDLTIHNTKNFVNILRQSMFKSYIVEHLADGVLIKQTSVVEKNPEPVFDIVSPTFFNDGETDRQGGCHWKTMKNHGMQWPNDVREVPFIDFQCPLISKRLLKEVGEVDSSLVYGWGIDAYFAIVCQQKNWKMGVTDCLSVLHHNSLTVKRGVAGITMQQYCQLAERGQLEFFTKKNLIKEFAEVRDRGSKYEYQYPST